jgi:hypothetical protein
MATVIGNTLVGNLSGTVGNVNFYDRKGKTVARVAKKKGRTKSTAAQIALQDRFSIAACFAIAAMEDPDLKFYYSSLARGGQSGYNMALKDAMSVPQISEIDFKSYNGRQGDKITIRARNFFKVYQIRVKIYNDTGVLIEEGNAVEDITPMVWTYRAINELDTRKAKVDISAVSIPGRVTTVTNMIVVR